MTTPTDDPDVLPEDPEVDTWATRPAEDSASRDRIAGVLELGFGEDEAMPDHGPE